MVRWSDGLYGGLIAGVTSAAFYVVAANALHDPTLDRFLLDVAQTIPPLQRAPEAGPLLALGVVLHFLVCAAGGIGYALLARHFRTMWQAPASVAWGLSYGLFVFWAINDGLVPLTGARSLQPLWVGLAGSMLCYGVVLSEYTAVARRRAAAAAAP